MVPRWCGACAVPLRQAIRLSTLAVPLASSSASLAFSFLAGERVNTAMALAARRVLPRSLPLVSGPGSTGFKRAQNSPGRCCLINHAAAADLGPSRPSCWPWRIRAGHPQKTIELKNPHRRHLAQLWRQRKPCSGTPVVEQEQPRG